MTTTTPRSALAVMHSAALCGLLLLAPGARAQTPPDAPPETNAGTTSEVTPTEPPAAAPETTPAAPQAASEPAAEPARPSAQHAFRVWVGGGFMGRHLNLSAASLGEVRQPATGSVNLGVSLFPGAAFTDNALAHLGAFFTADLPVAMASKDKDQSTRFAQSGSRLQFGVQWRFVATERLALVAHAGWSRIEMGTAARSLDGLRYPLTPDVLFEGLRGGVSVQWHVWERLSAEFNLAALSLLGTSPLSHASADVTGGALDLGAVVTVELLPHIAARASLQWQRCFLSLGRADGYDNYLWLNVGLQWSM